MIGIIFDCDGTLVDSEYVHFRSWQEAMRARGLDLDIEEYYVFAGKPAAHIAKILHERVGVDSPEEMILHKRAVYKELHKGGIPPILRTLHFLKELLARKEELGIKVAVASAAQKGEILINLEHLGLPHAFDAVVSGESDLSRYLDPEGVNKPKPYIYLHTAELLGLKPSRCIAFEDSATGVEAAVRAGMVTFAVPNHYTQEHDFSKATFVIPPHEEIEVDAFFRKIRALLV